MSQENRIKALRGLSSIVPTKGNHPNVWAAVASGLSGGIPSRPSKTSAYQISECESRFEKRLQKLQAILPISSGRVVPDDGDLMIGTARRLKLAILFLDICQFSQIPNTEDDEQDRVLELLNLFMAEMLHIVRDYEGTFEKNTGDGLMAYFGGGTQQEFTQKAIDTAVTMHCYNDQVISPRLLKLGLPAVRFRLGIESGSVIIANVGVRGDHHSHVAVGTTANVACKLMNLLPNGGIVLGNATRDCLREEWKNQTKSIGALPGFVFKGTTVPYTAWELTYRVPATSSLNVVNAFGL